MEELKRCVVNRDALPKMYPTHRHEPIFWENLGRVVATFGFLEETLAKAILHLLLQSLIVKRKSKRPWASGCQSSKEHYLINSGISLSLTEKRYANTKILQFSILMSSLNN